MRLLSLFILSLLFQISTAAERKPNIVFCFADDMGRYASLYQQLDGKGTLNDLIKTPNIDRIAKEGVLFKNAHVCAPSCTPCRSSLLSGQYFWRTGRAAILQGAKWDPKIPAFPLLLKGQPQYVPTRALGMLPERPSRYRPTAAVHVFRQCWRCTRP